MKKMNLQLNMRDIVRRVRIQGCMKNKRREKIRERGGKSIRRRVLEDTLGPYNLAKLGIPDLLAVF